MTTTEYTPLRFPDHYPPVTRWKKFFIGVRWLGPDLSFFKTLNSQQANRSTELMAVWGGGIRQEVAELIASRLSKSQRWKTEVFLPRDSFNVICHGPTFDWGNEFALEETIEEFENIYCVTVPLSFWGLPESITFGELVDNFVEIINLKSKLSS